MKRFTGIFILLLLCFSAVFALAADPIAAPALAAPPVSLVAWFEANAKLVFGFLLVLSELLAVTPWFKGNGILDSVVKALTALSGKSEP